MARRDNFQFTSVVKQINSQCYDLVDKYYPQFHINDNLQDLFNSGHQCLSNMMKISVRKLIKVCGKIVV